MIYPLFTIIFAVASAKFTGRAQCRDMEGKEVDWFLILKQDDQGGNTGKRYIYYDSDMSKDRLTQFLPLQDNMLIDDADSPIIQTIYGSLPMSDIEDEVKYDSTDNTVWLTMSDQPPKYDDSSDSDSKSRRKNKDAHGKYVNAKGAHTKLMLAGQYHKTSKQKGKVFGYLLHTSLPRFPKLVVKDEEYLETFSETYNIRSRFPKKKSHIFDENLKHKGQHFFCASFGYDQALQNEEIPFQRLNLKLLKKTDYIVTLLEYFETVHGTLFGYNFRRHDPVHRVWHQYFGTDDRFYRKPFKSRDTSNYAKSISIRDKNIVSSHLLPLDGGRCMVGENGLTETKETHHLRDPGQFNRGKCQKWQPENPGQCLSSGTFITTHGTEITILAKHGLATINLWSDILAMLSISPLQYKYKATEKLEIRSKLLVQSWFDHSTYPTILKTIVEKSNLVAKISVENVSSFEFPVHKKKSVKIKSLGNNHSKIGLFIGESCNYGLIIADGNNTALQRKQTGKDYGRGAGGLFIKDRYLWEGVKNLNPLYGKLDSGDCDWNTVYESIIADLN